MAEIKSFYGIRYDRTRFDDEQMARLVAPPYDVIDEAGQDELYERHPQNIVRLDLNRHQPGDHAENNRYTRSRRHLMDWLATGVMKLDGSPAIYVHVQDFDDETGRRHTRKGFVALARLADYEEGIVLPHERTLRGPKIDRLELMKATECNLSQVFFLYDDEERKVDALLFDESRAPYVVDLTTDDGVRHKIWPIFDEEIHRLVAAQLDGGPLLIADGHHRYETALAYRDFRREVAEEPNPDAPYEYTMGFFVNVHDPGLEVFPTHRVVHGVDGFDADALRKRLKSSPLFELEELGPDALASAAGLKTTLEEAGAKNPSFVLAAHNLSPLLVRYVGDETADIFDAETPPEVRRLDVAVLHEGILDRLLGISKEAQEAKTNLKYIKGLAPAIEAVEDPTHQLVVLMNPTPVEQVSEVCLSGGKMPQKSTFFYPKILSGLVINPL
ncbi:MAG: DUF1015 domain-containing protein [Bradymonadaceae bacterium]